MQHKKQNNECLQQSTFYVSKKHTRKLYRRVRKKYKRYVGGWLIIIASALILFALFAIVWKYSDHSIPDVLMQIKSESGIICICLAEFFVGYMLIRSGGREELSGAVDEKITVTEDAIVHEYKSLQQKCMVKDVMLLSDVIRIGYDPQFERWCVYGRHEKERIRKGKSYMQVYNQYPIYIPYYFEDADRLISMLCKATMHNVYEERTEQPKC